MNKNIYNIYEDKHMNIIESLTIEPNVYYTKEEVAQLLRVSHQAIVSLLEAGKLPGMNIDGEWRVLGAVLLDLPSHMQESEASLLSDWLAVSARSLKELWDNEEDSIYDQI
jgi:hypothetical protein